MIETFLAELALQRAKLWSRVYSDAMNGGYLNERPSRGDYAKAAADRAVEDFDLHVPKAVEAYCLYSAEHLETVIE